MEVLVFLGSLFLGLMCLGRSSRDPKSPARELAERRRMHPDY